MRKKIPSTFINMCAVLTGISLSASFLLGLAYTKTQDAIERVKNEKIITAVREVLPEFDNDPLAEKYTNAAWPLFEFYPAKKNGQPAGTAVRSYSPDGFSGNIWIIAGFLPDGTIFNVKLTEHGETPGLGSKSGEMPFIGQFINKHPVHFILKVKKDGGSVDAVTAATISSRAFCDALSRAYSALNK